MTCLKRNNASIVRLQGYRRSTFWIAVLDAFYQSLVCFFIPYWVRTSVQSHVCVCSMCFGDTCCLIAACTFSRRTTIQTSASSHSALPWTQSLCSPSSCIWPLKSRAGWVYAPLHLSQQNHTASIISPQHFLYRLSFKKM